GCAWSAVSSAGWIVVTGGASGSGNGMVSYAVSANPGAARSGSLSIADQTFAITQDAFCAGGFAIPPISPSLPTGGATATAGGTPAAGCTWTAVSSAPWITVTSGAGGSGTGSVAYSVAANGGGSRTGTLAIAGQVFTVTQAGAAPCTIALSPASASF